MIFRTKHNTLIEIVRKNYVTDKEYYNAILKLK